MILYSSFQQANIVNKIVFTKLNYYFCILKLIIMKQSEFGVQLFTGNKSISSKRVCGFTGGMVSVFICLWCTFAKIEAPQIADMLFICSTSLLGVEAVTSMFHKESKKEDKTN